MSQKQLSEYLQLLRQIRYSALDAEKASHSNRAQRSPEVNNDIHILDAIAVALTSGTPGDVTAVTFDS